MAEVPDEDLQRVPKVVALILAIELFRCTVPHSPYCPLCSSSDLYRFLLDSSFQPVTACHPFLAILQSKHHSSVFLHISLLACCALIPCKPEV